MMERHTYYLPFFKKVFGTEVEEESAFLFATYLRHLPPNTDPGRYDGVSVFYVDGERTVNVVVGNRDTRLPPEKKKDSK